MWDQDINPNSIRTTPKVKQHLIKSLMIFSQTNSDYGVYQRSYIKPLYLEESSSRYSVESTMNQARDLESRLCK